MKRFACLALPVALILGACSYSVRVVDAPRVQLISEPYGVAEIRAALIRAMDSRKFIAEKEEEGRITAHFQKHDDSIHVVIEYSPTQFDIRYVDSQGFGESKSPDGKQMVNSRYDSMIAGLDKAINEELKRPAKERAAAERAQRDYDAMIQMAKTQEANANAQAAQASQGQADADAQQAQANADAAAADANAAQANADAAQANANAPPPTIINKTVINKTVINKTVNNTTKVQQPAAAGGSFCDKAVKAIWTCPSADALQSCKANRGNCSKVCRVGAGC